MNGAPIIFEAVTRSLFPRERGPYFCCGKWKLINIFVCVHVGSTWSLSAGELFAAHSLSLSLSLVIFLNTSVCVCTVLGRVCFVLSLGYVGCSVLFQDIVLCFFKTLFCALFGNLCLFQDIVLCFFRTLFCALFGVSCFFKTLFCAILGVLCFFKALFCSLLRILRFVNILISALPMLCVPWNYYRIYLGVGKQ